MREVYDQPPGESSRVSWSDAFELSVAGFLLSPSEFLEGLKTVHQNLHSPYAVKGRAKKETKTAEDSRPRSMIYGSNVSIGDRKVLDIISQSDCDIVADAVCTGSKFWRKDVSATGRPLRALAERYLTNVSCPFMMDTGKRISYVAKVARDKGVNGLDLL